MRYLLVLLPLAMAVAQPQQATTGSPLGLEVKLSASWYQPKMDAVNQAYANLEQAMGYRHWGNSAIPYFANLEAYVPVLPKQSVVLEFGGSVFGRAHQDDHSWTSIFRGGAGYRYRFLELPVRVSAQGTLGYLRENFSRSYSGGDQSLTAAKGTFYVTILGAASYPLLKNISAEVTLGYSYVKSVTLVTPAAKVDLKAPMIGFGIVTSIL